MIPIIQNSFISGELSPGFLGRTDKPQYRNGSSTMRNMFVRYMGGSYSRAGFSYCGMCKQGAPNAGGTATKNPPRDINFQFNINQGYALEFGDQYMRIKSNGSYVVESGTIISAATNANILVITDIAHGYSNGDWIFITGMTGMTNLNGLTWIVTAKTNDTYQLTDLFGNIVNSINFGIYTSGGIAERIYTVVSPYAAIDLSYLKFTQNANLMNLVCWNQETNTEYPPYTLQRNGQTNWVFTAVSFLSVISPPTGGLGSYSTNSTTLNTWYSYVVTSIDKNNNQSVASTNTDTINNDISINAGSNNIVWNHVPNAVSSNVYAATPIFTTAPFSNPGFIGVPYGFIGSTVGGQKFVDTNIIPDFTITPPLHKNPFARGQILDVVPTAAGTVSGTVGFVITTSTGSGFSGTPITATGKLVGFLISDNGMNYISSDTMTITGMSGASVMLTLGPQSGTYPGVAQYYQQRLTYANTINQPDTYFMSQPGLYNNFDSSIPVVDSDAIIGTPWGTQINGIQFMLPSIQGLLAFTGNGVWLINGGNNVAITPSDQNAQAQAQVGCSALLPPLYINLHVLYVQAKNSIVRDISFNFLYNTFVGSDITVFSNHLFLGYELIQWAYSEEPFKVLWAVRNDGSMLSLTYIKDQEIQGWARHDTNGLFIGVCSVIEPPVDAIYTIVKRYIAGEGVWAYYSERANNRQWNNVEECFCVDSGLSLPMIFPNAVLTPSAAEGTNNISSIIIIDGGKNYTNPQANAIDSSGAGHNATFTVAQTNGVITSIVPNNQGENYTAGLTSIVITDSTGSGAIAQAIITNNVTFTADSSVFTAAMVGDVIRVDGGIATIISQTGTACIANITQPLTMTIPNDSNNLPIPAVSGTWSVAHPTITISGLNHLEGMEVVGLADGGIIVPQMVTNGSITLQTAASAVTVGLPFTAQLQSMYLDAPSQTTNQGKRKDVQAVTVRIEASRGIKVGTNQPDQSVQPNQANIPWTNLKEVKERNNLITAGSAIPLFTGDTRIIVPGDWATNGQIAIENSYPLPLNVLAIIPEFSLGDANA